MGTEGGAPPLSESEWVRGPESRIIRIVLNGVRGPLEVGGKDYDLEMLGFGPILRDEDVAAILSYVRARFGEPSPPITPAAVKRVRDETAGRTAYWTVEELLEIE